MPPRNRKSLTYLIMYNFGRPKNDFPDGITARTISQMSHDRPEHADALRSGLDPPGPDAKLSFTRESPAIRKLRFARYIPASRTDYALARSRSSLCHDIARLVTIPNLDERDIPNIPRTEFLRCTDEWKRCLLGNDKVATGRGLVASRSQGTKVRE